MQLSQKPAGSRCHKSQLVPVVTNASWVQHDYHKSQLVFQLSQKPTSFILLSQKPAGSRMAVTKVSWFEDGCHKSQLVPVWLSQKPAGSNMAVTKAGWFLAIKDSWLQYYSQKPAGSDRSVTIAFAQNVKNTLWSSLKQKWSVWFNTAWRHQTARLWIVVSLVGEHWSV